MCRRFSLPRGKCHEASCDAIFVSPSSSATQVIWSVYFTLGITRITTTFLIVFAEIFKVVLSFFPSRVYSQGHPTTSTPRDVASSRDLIKNLHQGFTQDLQGSSIRIFKSRIYNTVCAISIYSHLLRFHLHLRFYSSI